MKSGGRCDNILLTENQTYYIDEAPTPSWEKALVYIIPSLPVVAILAAIGSQLLSN
jgi:hypothetical protein